MGSLVRGNDTEENWITYLVTTRCTQIYVYEIYKLGMGCIKDWADAPYYHNHSATIVHLNTHPPYVAHNTISRYPFTVTQFNGAAKYRDELKTFNAINDTEIERARWSVDLGLRKEITENLSLYFDVLNLGSF